LALLGLGHCIIKLHRTKSLVIYPHLAIATGYLFYCLHR